SQTEDKEQIVFIHHLLCSDKYYRGKNQGPGVRPTGLTCLSDLECVKQNYARYFNLKIHYGCLEV
ncbi:MAG: hypothetical protein ACLFPG_08425, partial [Desulfohalobiaceae bacterium]